MSRYPFNPNGASTPGSGVYGLLTPVDEAAVILVPVPFDATTSYRRGTAGGPAAILEASRQVDLFDLQTGRPYEAGIAMLPEDPQFHVWNEAARAAADPVIAEGGVWPDQPELAACAEEVDRIGAAVNERVYQTVKAWLDRGRLVGLVGGDHSTPFGAIQAASERWPGLGVLHIDAHADLRVAYEGFTWSHASILHNVLARLPGVGALVQVGIRDLCEEEYLAIEAGQGRVWTHFDLRLAEARAGGQTWAAQVAEILRPLPDQVYITFDIDGLDPVLCPHTGTPVPGGLSFSDAVTLIQAVVQSGRRIVGFDLNEVAPGPDGDEWDANVGARMLYKLIGFALMSQAGARG